jgi:RND superfamily putative drug exporter
LKKGPGVSRVATQVAKDHQSLLVQVVLKNLDDDAVDKTTTTVTNTLHASAATLRGDGQNTARVRVGGSSVLNQELNDQASADLSKAEDLSLPITLVVLVFIFGGVIAAGLPVLAAVMSIAFSMVVLFLFTRFTSIDSNAVTVVTLLGLGLSIDYGLLLVARYREELAAGHEPHTAIGRAWATAGRTIAFSALTVAAALSGLTMFGLTSFTALGAAGISVALAAMLVTLTFTAALIGLARKRIRPSKRARRRPDNEGFFGGLARRVQRRPVLTLVVGVAALIALAAPATSMALHLNDPGGMPASVEAVQVDSVLKDSYGQDTSPAVTVVARTDAAALDKWAAGLAGAPGVARIHPAEPVGGGIATVDISATGDNESSAAQDLVDRIRADRPPGGQSWVTGDAAFIHDVDHRITSHLLLAVLATVLAMSILLFLMTGSVVVPLKAIAMNVVSIGATFGAMTAVFQHGFLAGPLGVLTVHGLSPFTVVSVFAFAFGLSMDYEVFLLGRIKEYVDQGYPTDVAVRRGLQQSGRIITSAALLMVIVFACFITGKLGNVQQIGLGLAVAVAVDATIVRCVLVPATMTVLGERNWWAPRWLKKVHRHIGLREATLEDAPAVVEAAPAVVMVTPAVVQVAPAVIEAESQATPVTLPRRKSAAVAYVWWLFLGLFGAHWFYLGNRRRGWLYLCTVGLLGLGWLVDPFTLPRQIRTKNGREATAAPAAEELPELEPALR